VRRPVGGKNGFHCRKSCVTQRRIRPAGVPES
jgi:hypothetical protein